MEEITTVIKGTELKVLFTATIDGKAIDYSDIIHYKILYYTTDKSKALVCSDVVEENTLNNVKQADGILVRIPTEELDAGALKCEATLYVEDEEFEDKLELHVLYPISYPSYDTYTDICVKKGFKDIKKGDILTCYNRSGDMYSITGSNIKLQIVDVTEEYAGVKILDDSNSPIFDTDPIVTAEWKEKSTSYDGYRKEIQRETTKIKIIE